jgi:ribonuclease R
VKQPLPSRAEILAFIAREREAAGGQPVKIGKREVAREFGIRGADKIGLKAILKELQAEGEVEKRGKRFHKAGMLPNVVLADVTGRDRDGELVATPVEWDEENGPTPRILISAPRKARPGQPVPGVGDRGLVRVELSDESTEKLQLYTGRVIKLLSRAKMQVLGIYRAMPQGGGRLIPVEKKNMNRELMVPEGAQKDAEDGDLVAVEIIREGRFGLPAARVKEKLGSLRSEKAVSLIAIHAHNIPNAFRPETLAEAESARPATMDHREDWRALPLVTIDPADAKDHDDAVHACIDDNPDNEGGFIVTVAIADVSAYVRPGRPLDREALERGNSVYFPDRVVPMLPERISNDLCSLRALEDRPALAVRMIIGADGQKKKHTFHRIMMRSAAKLAYPQAQAAIDGHIDDITAPLLETVLRPLWAAYECVKQERGKRSPLDLDLPERKILLKPDGTVDRIMVPTRLDAHRLIEEFMILANVAAAETLEQKSQQLIYRAHDEPSAEKLTNLSEFLSSIGIKLAKGQVLRTSNFNDILARVKGTDNEHVVNEIVLRTQAQAEYVDENYGHFGLNLKRYAHFTSPIRRYADLIVHRALIRALKLGPDGLPDLEGGELAEIAARISASERRAMAAERETTDRLIAGWLSEQIGATFQGRIAGVTKVGLFVKLSETGADGFIPAATLGTDYFRHEEGLHALIGNRTGETFRLGDPVEVKLVEAAPFAGALRFEMLSDGKPRPGGGGFGKKAKSRRDTPSPRKKGGKASLKSRKKQR